MTNRPFSKPPYQPSRPTTAPSGARTKISASSFRKSHPAYRSPHDSYGSGAADDALRPGSPERFQGRFLPGKAPTRYSPATIFSKKPKSGASGPATPNQPAAPICLKSSTPIFLTVKTADPMRFLFGFFKKNLQQVDSPAYSHLVRWQNTGQLKNFFTPDSAAHGTDMRRLCAAHRQTASATI